MNAIFPTPDLDCYPFILRFVPKSYFSRSSPCLVLLTEVKLTHSGGGGEYIFPLHGHCHHPKPQGPFTIRAGQSIPVQFKNVFSAPTTFLLSVDNPLFSVKQSELIRAKKTINIMVTYNGSPR